MKNLLFLFLVLFFSACSSKPSLTMYKNDAQMILDGGLPMPFFYPTMENQEYIRCFRNSFCSLFPEFKENDFKKMSHPWSIMTHQTGYAISINQTIDNKGIVLSYSVNIDTTISPYSEGDKALEEKDEEALKEYYNSYVGKRLAMVIL